MSNKRWHSINSFDTDYGWETGGVNEYRHGKKNGTGAYDSTGSPKEPKGKKNAKASFSKRGKRGLKFTEDF